VGSNPTSTATDLQEHRSKRPTDGSSCSSGRIYWSQLPAACGPPAGLAAAVVPGHGCPRTALDGPGRKHTRRRGVHPALKDRITLSDREVRGERTPSRRYAR